MTTTDSASTVPARARRGPFTFTDDGCRTEIRIGGLLVLAGVFGWLWLGPAKASTIYLLGLPLLLVGVPLQVRDAWRRARPGFPWKLGVALTAMGALMWPDLSYRTEVGGPLRVQELAPMLLVAGLWILVWWPLARRAASAQVAA